MTSDLEAQVGAAFEAMAAGSWNSARNGFAALLEIEELPEALIGLANASYWLGDLAGVVDSFERAYAAARKRPDPVLAAAAALSLVGYHKQFLGNAAAARGWLARGARIIETEAPQLRGELLGARSFVSDDPVECERFAREAWDIGRENGNVDLEVLAMTAIGGALVQQGRTAEGMALLDEAMAAAIGGGCSDPLTAVMARQMLGGRPDATEADPYAVESHEQLRVMVEMMRADHDVAQGDGHWKTVLRRTFDRVSRTQGYTVDDLQGVVVPTLVLVGDRDPFCSVEEGVGAFRALPEGELAVLPGIGNGVNQAGVQAMVGFFERHAS